MTPQEGAAYERFRKATIELRDAELLLRKMQEQYREALGGLNRAIAPVAEPVAPPQGG